MLTSRTRSQTSFLQVWGILWRLAAIIFAFYGAWRVRFILIIVLLSVILTFIIHPLVDRVCRVRPRWVPRSTWRFCATFAVFLALAFVCVLVVLEVWAPFQAQLTDLQRSMGHYQVVALERLDVLRAWYQRLPESMRVALAAEPVAGLTGYLFGIAKRIIESSLAWVSHIWELILIPVLAFYFCLDSRSLKRELLFLVPYRRVRETLFILHHTGRIMQNYIVAQIILCVIAGVTVGVGLRILDVPYPLVLGVLAGITRAVPIVGPVFSAIPITLLSVAVSLKLGLYVLLFFSILHLFESKVLLPQLVGHSIKLHPAIILIVLLVGGEFFGILGMFLAAPVAAILRMLLNLYVVEPEVRRRKSPDMALDGHGDDMEESLRKVS